jgi:hypothetical protein
MRSPLRSAAVLLTSLAVAVVPLAGCSSSSDEPSGSTSPTAVAYSPTTMSCDQFAVRAANLVTFVHYVGLNVGTSNDSSPYWAEMDQALADLKLNQPACAPDAARALDDLGAAVATLESGYKAGTDDAAQTLDRELLAQVTTAGAAAWTAMKLDAAPWETAVRTPA